MTTAQQTTNQTTANQGLINPMISPIGSAADFLLQVLLTDSLLVEGSFKQLKLQMQTQLSQAKAAANDAAKSARKQAAQMITQGIGEVAGGVASLGQAAVTSRLSSQVSEENTQLKTLRGNRDMLEKNSEIVDVPDDDDLALQGDPGNVDINTQSYEERDLRAMDQEDYQQAKTTVNDRITDQENKVRMLTGQMSNGFAVLTAQFVRTLCGSVANFVASSYKEREGEFNKKQATHNALSQVAQSMAQSYASGVNTWQNAQNAILQQMNGISQAQKA